MIRSFLAFGFIAGLAIFASAPASAQPAPAPQSQLNCDSLNEGTLICVRNDTAKTIRKIACSGMWGTTALSVPQGTIRPGTTTIVDFQKSKCNKLITITMSDGRTLNFENFDTTKNVTLIVDSRD